MRLSSICCLSSFVFACSLVICWQRAHFCTTDRAPLQKSLSTWRWHSSSFSLRAPHHTLSSLCACYNLSPSGCARPSPLFVLRKPLILSLECLPPPDSVATTCDCQLHTQSNYKLLGGKTKPFLNSSAEMWQSNFPFCALLKSRCLCSFSSSVSLVFLAVHAALCLHRMRGRPIWGGLPAAVWMWERRPVWQTDRTVQLQRWLDWRVLWERWDREWKTNSPTEILTSWGSAALWKLYHCDCSSEGFC